MANSDLPEAAELAHGFLTINRCPGGRLVVSGYKCPHCQHDYTVDDGCAWPRGRRQRKKPYTPEELAEIRKQRKEEGARTGSEE